MANGDEQGWRPQQQSGDYQIARLVSTVENLGRELERFRDDINKQFDRLDVDVKDKIKELGVSVSNKADKRVETLVYGMIGVILATFLYVLANYFIRPPTMPIAVPTAQGKGG